MSHTEATIIYQVYLDGYALLGTVQADLPEVQAITTEVKGAGIAGTIDSPVKGLFQGMSMTLNFRTVTPDFKKIQKQQAHHIELWAAVQTQDPATGKYGAVQHKFITRATPKNLTPGKLSMGETQDRTIEFEVTYFKEVFGNDVIMEIDKYNMIYVVDGEDLLQEARDAIGM